MSKQKPSIPKGTRDFGPAEMAKRNYILNHIREVYRRYGYQQLETPSMENLSVLTGKYGDEGDQLLFKILNSGDFFKSERKYISNQIKYLPYILNVFYDICREAVDKAIELKEIKDNDEVIKELKIFLSLFDKNSLNRQSSDYFHLIDSNVFQQFLTFLKEKSEDLSLSILSFIAHGGISEQTITKTKFSQFKANELNKKYVPEITTKYLWSFDSGDLTNSIAEKGLRYDLTVPFARYVVMNQNEITFPFRRFQIQPVWRADRPQKGRYREFYQCDADVVGTDSLTCEAEIVLMIEEVFQALGVVDISIKINNRKILSGLVETVGAEGKESDLLVAIDKLDKIGQEKVLAELEERGFSKEAIESLLPVFTLSGSNQEKLQTVKNILSQSEEGLQGVAEIEEVIQRVQLMGSEAATLEFDITLARGLSYYTGAIFEVKANNAVISSSISGGGRYDNLTGVFGMPGMSGVGISFGVDRIYDVMEGLDLFPKENLAATQVLFIAFDDETEKHALSLLSQVRSAGISAEIYPDRVKLKKQFAYADKKGIPYTIVIGSDEVQKQAYGLKNLKTREQEELDITQIIERLKQ